MSCNDDAQYLYGMDNYLSLYAVLMMITRMIMEIASKEILRKRRGVMQNELSILQFLERSS